MNTPPDPLPDEVPYIIYPAILIAIWPAVFYPVPMTAEGPPLTIHFGLN